MNSNPRGAPSRTCWVCSTAGVPSTSGARGAPIHRTAGFTLLELVVALTVAGLALSFGVAGFGQVVDRRSAVERRVDRDLGAVAVRSTLESWIRGARLGTESGAIFSGMDSELDRELGSGAGGLDPGLRSGTDGASSGLDDELTVTTSAPTPLGTPRTLVRIFVDRDSTTAERGLVAELRDPTGLRELRMELDTTALGLDVQYLSGVTGSTRWLPSWVSSSVLPRGLELRIVHERAAPSHPLMALPLRVALDGGR